MVHKPLMPMLIHKSAYVPTGDFLHQMKDDPTCSAQ